MSDQRMNAADQGTQPDSGSAPNDQVVANAAAGKHRGAPASSGSQPLTSTPDTDQIADQDDDSSRRDNIQSIKG